jgi:hypothetical protein
VLAVSFSYRPFKDEFDSSIFCLDVRHVYTPISFVIPVSFPTLDSLGYASGAYPCYAYGFIQLDLV